MNKREKEFEEMVDITAEEISKELDKVIEREDRHYQQELIDEHIDRLEKSVESHIKIKSVLADKLHESRKENERYCEGLTKLHQNLCKNGKYDGIISSDICFRLICDIERIGKSVPQLGGSINEALDYVIGLEQENKRYREEKLILNRDILREVTKIMPGGGHCPNCDVRLIGKANYCGKCGQKVGWKVYD